MSELPYRDCVGAALFNAHGQVLIARRAGLPDEPGAWQMPQGGIDIGETPEAAVLRELEEEIGTRRATVIAEHPQWLTYDLPAALIGRALGGRYRGQRQRWFALRFDGIDSDIRLDAHQPAEFAEWRWEALAAIPRLVVAFKQPIYRILSQSFASAAATPPRTR